MTIAEIRHSDKPMLLPADVAEVLQMDAQAVRDTAANEPEKFGFPVIRIGRHEDPSHPVFEIPGL